MDFSTANEIKNSQDKVQIHLNKKDIEWLKETSANMANWLKSIALLLLAQLLGGFATLLFFLLNQIK